MRSHTICCAAMLHAAEGKKLDLGPVAAHKRGVASARSPVCTAALLLVMVLCMLRAFPAHAETVTLRLSLPVSLDSPTGQNIREFARQIHARTSGELKIEFHSKGGRPYEEHEIVGALMAKMIDIGAAPLNQFTDDVPLTRAFLQPFLFNFDALIQAATAPESEIRSLIDNEILHRSGARVLWWQPYGSSVMLSKSAPAANPATIASRAIGVTDDHTAALIKACGGAPRRLASSEILAGLQGGTIEVAAIDIMTIRERDLWRVAGIVTELRHAPSLFVIVISDKAWTRLTSEQREILAELAQDAQAYMWARYATVRAEAYAFAAEKGVRFVEPSSTDVTAWRACSAPLLEAYVDRAGAAVPKLFAAYGRLRTAPCCREAPEERNPPQ